MNVTVISGKGDKERNTVLKFAAGATVKDLKKEFARVSKKDIHRISFKFEADKTKKIDSDSKTLESVGITNDTVLRFKDLGPQIGYRTVFLVEYFGPMVFVLLYAMRPAFIYGKDAASADFNTVAALGVVCWVAHFLKRELETIFVHKFSRPTMPLQNLFKNCAYYWIFGAVIGHPLCSPSFVAPSDRQVHIGVGIFIACEIGNLICHLMLSNMRPKEGSTARAIPSGFLFNYVACPNYTFEVMSWVGFSIMTGLKFSYLFTLVGFLQMADWAMKKHKGYKKTYDKEYTSLKRKAIIPFVY